MVGSTEYNRKEEFAKRDYLEGLRKKLEKDEEGRENLQQMNEAFLIDGILEKAEMEEPGLEGEEALRLRCTRCLKSDDKEDWMKISPEQLDSMLAQKHREFEEYDKEQESAKRRRKEASGVDKQDEKVLQDFEGLVSNMKGFVDTVSAYEGAEFPREQSRETGMDIDPDLFVRLLKSSLAPDGEGQRDDDEDMSEDEEFYSPTNEDDMSEEELGERQEGGEDPSIRALMDQMDRELFQTKVGQDFEKTPKLDSWGDVCSHQQTTKEEPTSEGEDTFRPVDVDLNLMKNILESLDAQHGFPGPLSNILNEMQHQKNK